MTEERPTERTAAPAEPLPDEAHDAPAPERHGVRGMIDRIRATPTGRIALKIVVGIAGTAIILVGLALVPLPGPGWLVVLAGLAVLALEFPWAKRVLHFTRTKVQGWTDWIRRRSLVFRLAVGLVGAALVALVLWGSVRASLGIDLAAATRNYLSAR